MIATFAKRLGVMVLTALCATFIVFLLVNLEPNLRKLSISQTETRASDEVIEAWLVDNGYRRPLLERYAAWLGVWPKQPNIDRKTGEPKARFKYCQEQAVPVYSGVLQGDFGCSTKFRTSVANKMLPALKATGILMFWVLVIMIPVSLIVGIVAGMREGSKSDRWLSFVSIITTATPEYVSGVLFTVIFATWLGWLNGSAATATSEGINFYNFALPVMTPAIYGMGYIARMTRASMVEVMASQYIRTARLKGLSFSAIVIRHALRNALIAPFTVIMLQFNWLLTGVVIVEVMFRYQGFGYLLVEAAGNNDIDLLLATAIVSAVFVLMTQFVSDIGYAFLNPRIRIR